MGGEPNKPDWAVWPQRVSAFPEMSREDNDIKKLRRRIEDRLRKDREALLLVSRLLNIK